MDWLSELFRFERKFRWIQSAG